MPKVAQQSSCSTMRSVFAFIVTFLSGIVFALEKCGVPAKPSHGQLRPEKPSYSYGEGVRVICEENYRLFGKQTDIQTCDYGVWIGKPAVCLRNLAYGRNLTHFGSPSGGKPRPHGGIFVYDVKDARESFFFDLFFKNGTTTHAYVYFHGNFSVTDQRGTELPFEQSVIAFNPVIQFYEHCTKSASNAYYDCISPDERLFTGAKVEISLLNKSIDMSKNFIRVKLQLEDNGFVVLDVADKDCGTPPVPFRGSVLITANSTQATYSCAPGYSLHGKSVQTCDVTKFPEITWQSRTPVCSISPVTLVAGSEEMFTATNTIVIAVVTPVGCLLIISVVAGIIWFNNKTAVQQPNLPNVATSMPLIDLANSTNSESDYINSGFLNMPPTPVQYPFIVSQNYVPSEYTSRTSYQNTQSHYTNVQGEHIYSTIDDWD